MSEKPTVLITGVAGLFGSNFAKYLCKKGYRVIGLDNLFGGYRDFVDDKVDFYHCELASSTDVSYVFNQIGQIDYLYHFAAYAACGLSPFIRKFNYENNVIASANLINEAINRKIKKFIFTSSMMVVAGEKNTPPYTEDMPYSPTDPYAIAKMAIELDLKDAYNRHGLDYVVVRPHNVQGINTNIWDRYRNVIGIFIKKALAGEDLVVYGDGSQIRAFSDIDYYMEPLEKLMFEYTDEVFHIGADKPCSILDLAKTVQSVAAEHGKAINIIHDAPRKETHTAFCDHTKAKNLLGFQDGTDIDVMVKKMYFWALLQPKRKNKNMALEIEDGVYSYWK